MKAVYIEQTGSPDVLRAAPHLFNRIQDIDRLLSVITAIRL